MGSRGRDPCQGAKLPEAISFSYFGWSIKLMKFKGICTGTNLAQHTVGYDPFLMIMALTIRSLKLAELNFLFSCVVTIESK